MSKLQEKASEFLEWFETKERVNGKEFVCLKDKAPKELTELVHKAHAALLPDDYKYEFVQEALDAIAETDDIDDITLEADIYNADLLAWLASHLERSGYVNEAVQEFGIESKDFELMNAISLGQIQEKNEVLSIVRSELETLTEE